MRCLADREVRQRRAFHEIAGGHIGCVGGGRCRRLLRGGRGAPGPLFPLLSRIRFRRGRLASFRVTAARCASGRSRQAPARPCSRRRPGLGTALARYSAARFSYSAGTWSPGCVEPPAQFLRWTDHLEIVLPQSDAARRCLTAGARSAPGTRTDGCSYTVAGRCLIIRVDDPGVARHELAHCNGWKHPEP
jgi:hypothetical protein